MQKVAIITHAKTRVIHYVNDQGQLLCGKNYKNINGRESTNEDVDCPRCNNINIWKEWDWSKNDAALAREHTISRERVRQIRKIINAPQSEHYKMQLDSKYNKLLQLPDDLWANKTNRELANMVQLKSSNTISILRRKHKKPKRLFKKVKYLKIDWSKSNKELAEELKIKENSVAVARLRYSRKPLDTV